MNIVMHTTINTHKRRGQSLVEALVALGILTTGILGIMTLLTKSFMIGRMISEDTQGTYLAAEGVEVVKNLIDHDVYYGLSLSLTNDYFAACFNGKHDYLVDYTLDTISPGGDGCAGLNAGRVSQPTAESTPLYLNTATHLYGYSPVGATKTAFSRDVEVQLSSDKNVLTVISTVYWPGNSVTVEDNFYDWHPSAL